MCCTSCVVNLGPEAYLQGSEMNDAVNIRMCLEDLVEVLLLSDVDIVVLGSLAGDELDAIDRLF